MTTSVRLTATQQEVVDFDEGALLVVAGPGSGKTRVLTERVRRLLTHTKGHFRVLCLTFTNKAANEMAERLDSVPEIGERAFIGTLHSFCAEVLANRGTTVGINGLPNIFDSYQDRKQILLEAIQSVPELVSILRSCGGAKEQGQRLDAWLNAISDAKNSLLTPDAIEDSQLATIYREYDASLRACDAIDFDDLLLLTYRLFEERPKIADFYRRQYKYICVDEAQDLNDAQYRLLLSLCGKEYRNVMLVGDPKQAIFTWNGASPKYLDMFKEAFDARTIELTQNFRSSQAVVAAAQILSPSYTIEGQLPIPGLVSVQHCDNEYAEATFVADKIEQLIQDGHPDIEGTLAWDRIAILGRNRFVFRAIEEELKTRKIPYYKKLSSTAYQSESDVMQQFELALRIVANPLDKLHLAALSKHWGVTFSAIASGETATDGTSVLQDLAAQSQVSHAQKIFDSVECAVVGDDNFKLTDGLNILETASASMPDEQRALVLEDVAVWRKHWNYFVRNEPAGSRSVKTFLSQMALGTTQQPREEGVALLTIHSAKGMEFDVVFLIAMVEGVFPDYRARGSGLDEEARNAFVAVTRSRRLLFLTYPNERLMPWGDTKRQVKSRFLTKMSE